MHRLRDSDLVIADLTDRNPNVFYELAIRHFLQKPIVSLMLRDPDQALPFDVYNVRTIKFDFHVASAESVKSQLRRQIEEVEANPKAAVDDPITSAGLIRATDREDRIVREVQRNVESVVLCAV